MARALRFIRFVAAGLALAALLALPAGAAGATWYVESTGNDGNDCQSPATACQTIQAAVVKASAGDTIEVAAGTYPEAAPGPLTVNKTLTLLGAQTGNDARSRAGAESIIADFQGTYVTASSVVIDGFTVQGSTLAAFTGYGIDLSPGVGGTHIVNNIIQNNIAGIGLANTGDRAVIKHNLIQNNNQAGGASGSGIYTDQFVGGATVSSVLITENTFTGNTNAGIDISNEDYMAGAGVYDVDVTSNTFDSNGRGVVLFNTHNWTIDGNSITNSTLVGSAAVRIFDNNTNLTVTSNDLRAGTGHGIRLSAFDGMPSSGVSITENNIENYPGDGLLVDPMSHTGTVDATCNWWNSATGPTNLGNPGGTGEEVVGDADFSPWLVAPAPNGACHGGVPSTPGKVTGGGQLQGDPTFSALGALLSLPAVMPSAAGGTSKSTFGFVVTCCAPKGNLEYDDHGQSVTIKATSIDFLSITTPGTSCPVTGAHAEFSGTADVTHAGVTTSEPFTVDVDDCGEPGTADTFSIETTSYSNSGTLVGGNIQIHKQ